MSSLHVPEIPDDADVCAAALLYAAAGWYVLPVDRGSKHAGSVVGKGWPKSSSRDPRQIAAWFAGEDHALALHVGRSGAVAFDVDLPENVPDVLADVIWHGDPVPYQSTRPHEPNRGHYVFAAPAGSLGNSGGELGTAWGDVRGHNGIIIVAPSEPRYQWIRTGPLPPLPETLSALLRPPGAGAGTVDDAAVSAFLGESLAGDPCPAVAAVPWVMPASGRHEAMNERVLRLVRLADQGHRGVPIQLGWLRSAFVDAVTGDGTRSDTEAVAEWARGLAGAVAEVQAQPTAEVDKGCCLPADLPNVDFDPSPLQVPGRNVNDDAVTLAYGPGTSNEGQVMPSTGESVGVGGEGLADALMARLLTAAQVRELRPPRAVVEGLLTLDSESWLIARPGSYKTFVALDLAAHVASGKPWQGRPVEHGPVLYLAAEGAAGMGKRVQAWEQRYGEMSDVHFLPMPVQVKRDDHWAALVEVARRLRPVLIVLDTQARITVGLNENDNSEMGLLIAALGRLRGACGSCVLVVHHLGRAGQDARGASAIDGAQDSELRLTRTADHRVVLETDKQRHLPDDVRVELELFPCDLDGGGTSLWVGAPLTAAAPLPDHRANLPTNQATLADVMRDVFPVNGATKAELKAEARKRARIAPDGARLEPMGDSAFRRAWDALTAAARFVRVEGTQRYVIVNEEVSE